jgi:hypothetical protein
MLLQTGEAGRPPRPANWKEAYRRAPGKSRVSYGLWDHPSRERALDKAIGRATRARRVNRRSRASASQRLQSLIFRPLPSVQARPLPAAVTGPPELCHPELCHPGLRLQELGTREPGRLELRQLQEPGRPEPGRPERGRLELRQLQEAGRPERGRPELRQRRPPSPFRHGAGLGCRVPFRSISAVRV